MRLRHYTAKPFVFDPKRRYANQGHKEMARRCCYRLALWRSA